MVPRLRQSKTAYDGKIFEADFAIFEKTKYQYSIARHPWKYLQRIFEIVNETTMTTESLTKSSAQ